MNPWWAPTTPVLLKPTHTPYRGDRSLLSAVVCLPGAESGVANALQTVGFCWRNEPGVPTINDQTISEPRCVPGRFVLGPVVLGDNQTRIWGRFYAINVSGTIGYSCTTLSFFPPSCLVEGTAIAVRAADGSIGTKPVQDIGYMDELVAWDFDAGVLVTARPLWIMRPAATVGYDELTLSDGRQLRTVGHRVLCIESGAFEPVGPALVDQHTCTLDTAAPGAIATDVRIVAHTRRHDATVRYFNIITNVHINLFADGVLTSCRLSNLAPIRGMRYVEKEAVAAAAALPVATVPPGYAAGLQLHRQPMAPADIAAYVARLQARALPGPVLFLDIQGVMRTRPWPRRVGSLQAVLADVPQEGPCFDADAVRVLNELLAEVPTLQLVISSDWGTWCSLLELQQLATSQGLARVPVAKLGPVSLHRGVACGRAVAIRQWLRSAVAQPPAWVAVDDLPLDAHLLPGHAVRTAADTGFTAAVKAHVLQGLLCSFSAAGKKHVKK